MPLIPIDPRIARYIPAPVLHKVGEMDEASQQYFLTEYDRRRKTLSWAIRSIIFGLHYLYFRRYLMCALFLMTVGGFYVWWIIDCFRLRRMLEAYNNQVALQVLRDIQVLR